MKIYATPCPYCGEEFRHQREEVMWRMRNFHIEKKHPKEAA